jgi:hypothetical protein
MIPKSQDRQRMLEAPSWIEPSFFERNTPASLAELPVEIRRDGLLPVSWTQG